MAGANTTECRPAGSAGDADRLRVTDSGGCADAYAPAATAISGNAAYALDRDCAEFRDLQANESKPPARRPSKNRVVPTPRAIITM